MIGRGCGGGRVKRTRGGGIDTTTSRQMRDNHGGDKGEGDGDGDKKIRNATITGLGDDHPGPLSHTSLCKFPLPTLQQVWEIYKSQGKVGKCCGSLYLLLCTATVPSSSTSVDVLEAAAATAAANGDGRNNAPDVDGGHPPAVGNKDAVAGILLPPRRARMTASRKTLNGKPAMTTSSQLMPTHTKTHNMSLASDVGVPYQPILWVRRILQDLRGTTLKRMKPTKLHCQATIRACPQAAFFVPHFIIPHYSLYIIHTYLHRQNFWWFSYVFSYHLQWFKYATAAAPTNPRHPLGHNEQPPPPPPLLRK